MTTATEATSQADIPDRFAEVADPEADKLDAAYRNLITEIAKTGKVAEHVKALRECQPYTPSKPLGIEYRKLRVLALRLWIELPRATLATLKPLGRTKETIVSDIHERLFEIVCRKVATPLAISKAQAACEKAERDLHEFLDGADERHVQRFHAERDGKNVSVECAVEKRQRDELSIAATAARDHLTMIETIAKKELPEWVTRK